jgi:hypothetical protein
MLSMPPATTISPDPATIRSCASLERRLPCGRLTLARRQDVAHDHFLHILARDARTRDRRPDRDGTEIARGERSEVALESAHGGARGSDNHHRIVQHCVSLRVTWSR